MEKRYDFKRELLKIHKDYRRDPSVKKAENEIEIFDVIAIVLPEGADKLCGILLDPSVDLGRNVCHRDRSRATAILRVVVVKAAV